MVLYFADGFSGFGLEVCFGGFGDQVWNEGAVFGSSGFRGVFPAWVGEGCVWAVLSVLEARGCCACLAGSLVLLCMLRLGRAFCLG
jgi:hypothetical protein